MSGRAPENASPLVSQMLARLDRDASLTRAPLWQRAVLQTGAIVRTRWLEARARMRGGPVLAPARTFWGDEMRVAMPELISRTLVRRGYFEEGLTRQLIALVTPGMTFVDVGAHLGYYSLLASRLVGPGGRVLALEPAPQTLELLAHNLRECPNATVVAAAAFSRSGPMTFNDLGLEYSAFSSYTRPRMDFPDAICTAIEVCGVRLDDLLADAPGAPMFVKIDAESAEAQVIEGMAATLERRRPMVSVEIGDVDLPGVVPSRQVVDQLLGLGYRVFEYGSREEPLRPHVPRERYDYDNLVFLP